MDASDKQSKAPDNSSPSKKPQGRRRNNSPKKANTAQTSNLEGTFTHNVTRNDQTNKSTLSPRKKSPQKHTSPAKVPSSKEASATQRPVLSRAYTSPIKQRRDTHGQRVCAFWPKGRCVYGENCLFVHEHDSEGGTATSHTQASNGGEDQSVKPATNSVRFDLRTCSACGTSGHFSKECPRTSASASSDAATSQLNAEVGRILAANSSVSLADENAFFESLEQTNSQAFTDHQVHGKLSESTIRRLLVHAYAVHQAAQDAMKLAYHSSHPNDYEKANSLDELAKEILNTPGLPLDQETKKVHYGSGYKTFRLMEYNCA